MEWERDGVVAQNINADPQVASQPDDNDVNMAGTNDQAEEPAQEKPKRRRHMLSEEHLTSKKGFKQIYHNFPNHVSANVQGNEAKALNDLMQMYKEWAYDLYPGLHFDDFIERTELLSRRHRVQNEVSDLRDEERKRVHGETEPALYVDDEPERTEPLSMDFDELRQQRAEPSGSDTPPATSHDPDEGEAEVDLSGV